ncbi:hypothetical protein LINPERPRIM_LOCUS19237, partial [Linum perenne]
GKGQQERRNKYKIEAKCNLTTYLPGRDLQVIKKACGLGQ